MRHGVIILPGIITPAAVAYARFAEICDGSARVVPKELAIYDTDAPPSDYGFETEIDGILETARRNGFDRFHLAGYSMGGAVCAAFASSHPDRLASLGLWEPAWFGNKDMSPAEREVLDEIYRAQELPPQEALPAFVRLNIAPGVEPPPRPGGDPPPWMAKRPAAIKATGPTFDSFELDFDSLRRFGRPVIYVLGVLSRYALYGERAERAATVFPDFRLETFDQRHHFDPPHIAEPERFARLMLGFWENAEATA